MRKPPEMRASSRAWQATNLIASDRKTGRRSLATAVMKRAGESRESWNLSRMGVGAQPRNQVELLGRSETFRTSGGEAAQTAELFGKVRDLPHIRRRSRSRWE